MRVDHRADIYATGCVAYWLLTGQLVFTGDTPMQLLLQHAQAAPEPPSSRTESPIPAELDAIVLACLAKDPSERPQTARELARRLEAVPARASGPRNSRGHGGKRISPGLLDSSPVELFSGQLRPLPCPIDKGELA